MVTSATVETATADLPCSESGFAQTNSRVLATAADKRRNEELTCPKASPENFDNQRSTSAAAVSPTTNVYSSDSDCDENCDNLPPPIVAAVSPATSVKSSGSEEDENCKTANPVVVLSATFDDDDEVKPISLDEFDSVSENAEDRRVGVELIKQLSFDSDRGDRSSGTVVKQEEIPIKDCTDEYEKKIADDCNEQDWTKKIAFTDCSGNLIEDLECDESSTSSMTTIIDSEQSSAAEAGDDLEDIFRLDDEKDEVENDENSDDNDRVDPLHSSCFVVFGDEYEGKKIISPDNGKETADSKAARPNTSKINPMSGEKSLTDDMQEWKSNVLSSWTLTPPKPKKKKSKKSKRTIKRKITLDGHKYSLRRKTDKTQDVAAVAAANVISILESSKKPNKCRELKNIASFNRPGVTEEYREKSSLLTSQTQKVVKQEAKTDKLASISNLECSKEPNTCRELKNIASFNSPGVTEECREKSALLTSRTQEVINQEASTYNLASIIKSVTECRSEPEKSAEIKARGDKYRRRLGRGKSATSYTSSKSKQFTIKVRIGKQTFVPEGKNEDGLQIPPRFMKSRESLKRTPTHNSCQECKRKTPPLPPRDANGRFKPTPLSPPRDANGRFISRKVARSGRSTSKRSAMAVSPPRDQELSPYKRQKRETKLGLQTVAATSRPNIPRSTKRKKVSVNEKPIVAKRKQPKTNSRQIESRSTNLTPKISQKRSVKRLNVETVSIKSTRIAKRFIVNPLRRKGKDKVEIFFGTVFGKEIDKDTDGNRIEYWHIIYDDGDEEFLNETELMGALDLFKNVNRRDAKHRNKIQSLPGTSEEKLKDILAAMKGEKSKPQRHVGRNSSAMPTRSILRQKKLMSACNPQEPCGKSKKNKVRFSLARSKQTDSSNGQRKTSRARKPRRPQLSTYGVDPEEKVSDDDSIEVLDVVDLTKDSDKVGNRINIVDLTISS